MRAAERGEAVTAEKLYRSCLAKDPAYYPALMELADLLVQQGRNEEAEELYESAAGVSGCDPVPHTKLGFLALQAGRKTEAQLEAELALRANPEYPDAWDLLAAVHQDAGRVDEADRAQRRAENLREASNARLLDALNEWKRLSAIDG